MNRYIKAGVKCLCDREYRDRLLIEKGFYSKIADEAYLKIAFNAYLGSELNLDDPKTFNEKLQWLKLYNRKREYTMMVDKYLVRSYISKTIGDEYLIPLIGVWDKVESINFDELPNQFVLKCNHNSGLGMCICHNKNLLNIEKVKYNLNQGLKQDYYKYSREWPYKDVPRKIVAEKFMQDDTQKNGILDYKFMCFNGKCKCIFTGSDRFSNSGLKITFYDLNWNILPFERHYPARKNPEQKPKNFKKMIELAEKLATGIPFVRIDFYEVNNKVYFGEMTFFPGSGFEEFTPPEWDYRLGSWLELPKEKTV